MVAGINVDEDRNRPRPVLSNRIVKHSDVVRVIDKGFNPPLTVEARVIKRRRPISGDRETELTLGNFRPEITDLSLAQSETQWFQAVDHQSERR